MTLIGTTSVQVRHLQYTLHQRTLFKRTNQLPLHDTSTSAKTSVSAH